jgi:hypothetical protein
MGSSVQIVVLVGAIMVCVLATVAATVVFVRGALRQAQQRLDAALAGQPVLLRDNMANFFGLASLGPVQLRGNGSLALTRDAIAFQPALRNKPPLLIPRSSIQKVESARSHLGKTVGRPLLTVHFTTATGETDVVAWLVRDLGSWQAQLGR